MTFQIYHLGEWERIGGGERLLDHASAYLEPNTYET